MVFLLLLSIVDFLAATTIASSAFGLPFPHLQAAVAVALVGKGLLFINDVLSVLDVIIGISILVFLWTGTPTFALFIAGYLALKGLYSIA